MFITNISFNEKYLNISVLLNINNNKFKNILKEEKNVSLYLVMRF